MGFHLKIKLATRPNYRPVGNFALNKIRDSVRIDLLSGFKDWVCFGKIGYKYGYLHCISSFKHKPFKKSLLEGQKSFGQTLATLPNCRPDGDFFFQN